jgi:protein Tex
MNETHLVKISQELKINPRQVASTAILLEEGATVPFIARYRKERTGELDEVQITNIRDRLQQLQDLDKRKESIFASLDERKLLTEELRNKIIAAETLSTLEDIYLPYRPKKRTKATIARERGLEPLADLLWTQDPSVQPAQAAVAYVDADKEVPDADAALAGARDIIAERINDDAALRAELRVLFLTKSTLRSRVVSGKEAEASKFKDYFEWEEPAVSAPSHRILAIRRGETEGFLFARILPAEEEALAIIERHVLKAKCPAADEARTAAHDAYKRLLCFAMEGEARVHFKKKADEEAIRVFAENLRELLLAAPLGQKRVLAIDPGFRTGCKVVLLDAQGKLMAHDVIYPEKSGRERDHAAAVITGCIQKFDVQAIAIGNGTASRETEAFIRSLGLPASVPVVMVSESGASIYSASDVAREEFPDFDVTVRGSVCIGRRLMDPLAELVKIDPKSIGVGQYQHDVDQNALRQSLDDTVISCVNNVGVELNTASKHLLSYVSGLNTRVAAGIVDFRNANGAFRSREQLKSVPGLGPKAFEQAAGFLRIREGDNPLDASAVHPERYPLVDQMAKTLSCSVADLLSDANLRQKIDIKQFVSEDVGLPTLKDILAELSKPGRDPRKQFEIFSFSNEAHQITDLKPGMKLPGIVSNVAAFGAFVDVGVHQDGLVHISQLSDDFVKNPSDVVRVGQKVQVTVVEVDLARKRIALSLKTNPDFEGGSKSGGERREAGKPRPGSKPAGNNRSQAPAEDWFTAALNRKY